MGLAEFLSDFRKLHELSKSGQLDAEKRAHYEAARNELARSLVTMDRVGLKPGQTWRQALRVARGLKIELRGAFGAARTITVDISVGGFAAPIAVRVPIGESIDATVHVPPGDPIACRATVVSCLAQQGAFRVSAAFEGLTKDGHDRIETAVFDTVLMKLK